LQISTTDYDTLIAEAITDLSAWLPSYLNNYFTDPNLYIQASTIAFSGTDITDSDSGFVTAGFVTGMDIYVMKSAHNDGFYNITTAAAETLTTDGSFVAESAADATPIIWRVKYPIGLKPALANLIKAQIDKQKQGVSSESIGGYSVSFITDDVERTLLRRLSPYRKVGF